MWFCVTSVGGVATLVIIVSLWEKFQTNPTITGLDTDFHNWDVAFPAVAVCPLEPANRSLVEQLVQRKWPDANAAKAERLAQLLTALANVSWPNLATFNRFEQDAQLLQSDADLRALAQEVRVRCEEAVAECSFKGDAYPCCSAGNVTAFAPLDTEIGFCFAFNSRHATKREADAPFKPKLIYETDEKWQLSFHLERLAEGADDKTEIPEYSVFIQSNDELPTLGVDAQHVFDRSIAHVSFGAKQTYTTRDAQQLSIRQRRCVFPDEIKLVTDDIYTYTACMSQCRMNKAKRLCQCVPFFYKPTGEKIPRVQNYVDLTVPQYSRFEFKSHFRLERESYEFLLALLKDSLSNQPIEGPGHPTLGADKQLLIAIWKMVTPDSYRSICDRFDVGRATALRAVRRVRNALFRLSPALIKWPDAAKQAECATAFERSNNFPDGYRNCDLVGLFCLSKNIEVVLRLDDCACELGCDNTVYEVEKLLDRKREMKRVPLEVAFISWPMVRYKREVLFGWVDLLVSFGGIAGLFLGFSLLSGVELLYYFTMRACCMVYRNAADLHRLQLEYAAVERPPLDLSLTPLFLRELRAQTSTPVRTPIHVAPFTNRPLCPRAPFDLEYLP